MKNKLIDVHNILMATLEDLDDPELMNDPERLKKTMDLAKVKSQVASTIVDIGNLGLNAMKQAETNGIEIASTLRISDK